MWFLTQLQKLYHIEASTLVTYEANMFVTNFKEFPLFDIISEGNSNVLIQWRYTAYPFIKVGIDLFRQEDP